jgi:glucose/arabinose dehydrogenase
MRRAGLLAGFLLALLAAPSSAAALGLQPVGTFTEPIFVTSPPGDPRLFVVERPGTIQVLHDGTRSQFLDIRTLVNTDGERGLLSMAFDPNYASNGLFYVFFNDNGTAGAGVGDIHVDEFRVGANPHVADPSSRRRVLTLIRGTAASNHNGGQLQFGKDGLLYVSVGDAANSANAQSLASPHGKILRIDPHGAGQGAHGVPSDNPFVAVAGAIPEIWSLGLRNPYRFSFDHLTGDLAIGDVGASSFEEIDFAPLASGVGRGANFGWPMCEGFQGSCPGTTAPVFAYAEGAPCQAIIGGYVYRGRQVPELSGRYLYTDLCHNQLRSIRLATPLAGDDRPEGLTLPASPFSFGEDANCELYVMGSNEVDRIVGSGSSATPACPAQTQKCCSAQGKKKKCKKKKKRRDATAAKHKGKKHKKRCKKKKYRVKSGFAGTVLR